MKYGLIIMKNLGNIGDDIQSYAMERFLPHVDYLIDREKMDSFYTKTGEKVAVIFGGWYLHKPLNWPPSPFLKVLPISIHFNKVLNVTDDDFNGVINIMDDYDGEWLKKVSPIGCRDEGTLKLLESFDIPAYLSGCITLTLKPFKIPPPREQKIILTDVPESVINFVKAHTKKEIVIISHAKKELIPFLPQKTSILRMTWTQRHDLVEQLLKFYQGASLVVTSRLHAALPCLALGTPVLLVNNKQSDYRFSTFIPYLNNTTVADLIKKRYVFNFDEPKANPGGHEKFAELIKTTCTNFVNACENESESPLLDVETWLDGHKRDLRLKKIISSIVADDSPLYKLIYYTAKKK